MERLLSGGRRVGKPFTAHICARRCARSGRRRLAAARRCDDGCRSVRGNGASGKSARQCAVRPCRTARLFAAGRGILEPGLTLREARIEAPLCLPARLLVRMTDLQQSDAAYIPRRRAARDERAGNAGGGRLRRLRACCVWDDARYSMAARVFCLWQSISGSDGCTPGPRPVSARAAARAIRPGACLQAAADAANAVLRARGCCADESRFLFAIGCARQERPLLDASAQWPLSGGDDPCILRPPRRCRPASSFAVQMYLKLRRTAAYRSPR